MKPMFLAETIYKGRQLGTMKSYEGSGKTVMNVLIQSKQAENQKDTRVLKLIPRAFTAILTMTLLTVGVIQCGAAETNLSTADKVFILTAAQNGSVEVKLGEQASLKGSRDDFKEFGASMAKDHTAINEDLKALAELKGVPLPASLDAKRQEIIDKMATLSGVDFYNAYISLMSNWLKADADLYKTALDQTQDADIKSFVVKYFPVVTEQLERISTLKK